MADKQLAIYLQDHFAGSTVGVELVKRAAGSNQGSAYGAELSRLATEIEEDRETLKRLMDGLGVGADRVKVAGGWIGEKLGRLKLNGSLLEYSPLSRLVEIEGLYLGVTGKLAMWENLKASYAERVSSVDLALLVERARSQQARLQELRTMAAAEALAGTDVSRD